jgi:DNA-binding transcriptional LysR family regulator
VIDKLAYLIALAREQHFGRAADTCGVTQPTLSAGIKQLEEQLGVLLVQRGSRFIGFTPEGQRTLDWARRIVGDAQALRDEIRALKSGLAGHLRLSVIPTALPIVTDLTAPFRQAHPNVTFSVFSRTSIQVLAQLENLEADVGLSYLDREPVGRVRSLPLYHELYRLVVAAGHPLASAASVTWKQLADLPLALLTPDMQNRRIIDAALRDAGVTPEPALQSDSMLTVLAHVRTGEWAGVLPAVLVDTLDAGSRMVAIPIEDDRPPPTVGLIYPQREPLTPLTAALLAEARRFVAARGLG